jgi:hypothetical protein
MLKTRRVTPGFNEEGFGHWIRMKRVSKGPTSGDPRARNLF